ncbi:MAG: VanZ family protein [Clostridia bacterium]|nr:VanZ family protein [Clostridia bacterium]
MRKRLSWALFALYLAVLLRLTVFRDGCFSHGLFSGEFSLTPFAAYRDLLSWGSYGRAAYLFFGNIGWFVPLGAFLAGRGRGTLRCTLSGLALSVCVEAGQYLLGSGLTEADDLLLNTFGAFLGWAAMRIWFRIRARRKNKMTVQQHD